MKTQVLRSRHPKRMAISSRRPSSHSMKDFSTTPGLMSKEWITRNMVSLILRRSKALASERGCCGKTVGGCHPEQSEGSALFVSNKKQQMLRYAQHDTYLFSAAS